MGSETSKPAPKVESELIFVSNPNDGHAILCKVWKPPTSLRGAVFFIHGGMFSKGSLHSHPQVSMALAVRLGLAVITASFRDGSSTPYASGKTLEDLKCIARHFRSHHSDELPFGIVGSSSGGWFALAVANELEKGEVDFLIPLCPVSDPHARAVYLQHCIHNNNSNRTYHVQHEPDRAQCILNNQLQFFESLERMEEAANRVEVNRHGIPTLLIVGAMDRNVPPQVTQQCQTAWATKTVSIGNAGHEIQNVFPTDPEKDFVPEINQFLTTALPNRKQSERARHSNSLFVVLFFFLLATCTLFVLCWWVANTNHSMNSIQTPQQVVQLPSLEEGVVWAAKPIRLIIEFLQMIVRGGARGRSKSSAFMILGS